MQVAEPFLSYLNITLNFFYWLAVMTGAHISWLANTFRKADWEHVCVPRCCDRVLLLLRASCPTVWSSIPRWDAITKGREQYQRRRRSEKRSWRARKAQTKKNVSHKKQAHGKKRRWRELSRRLPPRSQFPLASSYDYTESSQRTGKGLKRQG